MNRYENTGDLTFNATFYVNENISSTEVSNPFSLKLYGRNFNSDSDWELLTYGSSADANNNSVTFNELGTYGQYLVSKSVQPIIALYNNQLTFLSLIHI